MSSPATQVTGSTSSTAPLEAGVRPREDLAGAFTDTMDELEESLAAPQG